MVSKKITIALSEGMEARPVALLVQISSQYESSIYIECEEKKINAKSIMGMMSIGLATGSQINVIADGSDEKEAMQEIEKYLCNKK